LDRERACTCAGPFFVPFVLPMKADARGSRGKRWEWFAARQLPEPWQVATSAQDLVMV
jgi:hypothetical protein